MRVLGKTHVRWLILVAAALPGPLFLCLSVLHGHLELTSDSANYIAAARGLASAGAFNTYDGRPFVHWPPLLPIVLFVGGWTGLSESAVGLSVNCVAWAALAVVTGLWAAKLTRRTAIGLAAALAVSTASAIYMAAQFLLSELLFAFLVMVSLYLLWRFTTEGPAKFLALAALAAALAVLTRYAGLFLVLGEAGALLLMTRQNLVRRAVLAATFTGCALLPLCVWLVRNYVEAGTLADYRYPSGHGIKEILEMLAAEIGRWWLPLRVPDVIREAVGGAILLALPAAALAAVTGVVTRRHRDALLLLGSACFVYFAVIAWSATWSNLCCFGGRFEAPYFAPIATAVALVVYQVALHVGRVIPSRAWRVRFAAACTAGVLLLSVVLSVPRIGDAAAKARTDDDMGAERWSRSQAIQWVRGVAGDAGLYSNSPAAIFLYANRYVDLTPRKGAYESPVLLDTMPEFKQLLAAHRENLLVWFRAAPTPGFLFDWTELSSRLDLTRVAQFPDAEIYLVGPR